MPALVVLCQNRAMLSRFVQSIRHRQTLKWFKNQKFTKKGLSISLEDALREGLLSSNCLYGEDLIRSISRQGPLVWKMWHDDSSYRRDAYLHFYDVDLEGLKRDFQSMAERLMPYERIAEIAANDNRIELLEFLRTLENPWEPWALQPERFLGSTASITHWVLDNIDPEKAFPEPFVFFERMLSARWWQNHARDLIWMGEPISASWKWDSANNQVGHKKGALERTVNALLGSIPWTTRWERLGSYIEPWEISLNDNMERESRQLHATLVAALVKEAPLATQILLCAFRNLEHPRESEHPEHAQDAAAIRHYFFDAPEAAKGASSAKVAVLLSLWNAEDVAGAEQWLLNDEPEQPQEYGLDHVLAV